MNKKILIFVIPIVILALLAFGFIYYRNTIFSKEVLRLEILGPEHASAGEEVEYTVVYKNNGNFVLQKPKLFFELPDHSLNEDAKQRFSQDLEDLYPGNEKTVMFKTRLLGKENEVKTAKAWLSYIPHNLSVRYESQTSLATTLDEVAMTLTYDMTSRAEKGKEITYSINYFSNIDYPLENMSLKIGQPSGFNFKSSTPKSLDNLEWKLETLEKGKGGRITIQGIVDGQAQSPLHFGVRLGMWVDGVFVPIKEASQDVEIISPMVFISQLVNGSQNYVASPGQTLRYEIFLRNLAQTPLDNAFISSSINGSAADVLSLVSAEGQARPNDHVVVFDAKQIPRLARIMPGQEVKVDFSVKVKDAFVVSDSERNAVVIKNTVTTADLTQEFSNKVNSKLDVTQKATLAGISYQITWQAKNYINNTRNVKIKAVLPFGVSLNDTISPEDQAANFSFDSKSREIVWVIGDLPAGAGVALASQPLIFEVSFIPGVSAGQLVGPATIIGEDQFTGATIQNITPGVSSMFLGQ